MSSAAFEDVYAAPLTATSLALAPGLTVLLGTPDDGSATCIELLAGSMRPRRGRVRVQGRDPHADSDLRKGICAVLADEPELSLPPSTMLTNVVGAPRAAEICARLGLAGVRSTSLRARRAVALEVALARPGLCLVAVFEPLALMHALDRGRNIDALQQLAQSMTVVCATASIEDARALGGDVVLLDRGRFVRRPGVPLTQSLAPRADGTFVVRAEGIEQLCQALVGNPVVQSVRLDGGELPNQAFVGGPEPEAVSRAILEASRSSGARLLSVMLSGPTLDESRGATAALWRAAYERAYYAARPAPALAPAPAPPAASVAPTAPAPAAPAPSVASAAPAGASDGDPT